MNTAPQEASEYVACRACGATHAPRHKGYRQRASFGLCDNCVSDFYVRNGNKRFTANELNGLIAAHLRNTLNRKSLGKVIGRCEAVTNPAVGTYQCAQHAQTTVKGRRVCTQHARSKSLRFVCDGLPDHYSPITDQLRLLAEGDEQFAATLRDLVNDLEAA